MALSRVTRLGDGTTTTFTVEFALGFLREDDVTCRVGSEPTDRAITFLTPTQFQIAGAAPGNNVPVVFSRTVSKTALENDFQDAETLTEEALDRSHKQALMATHEALDNRVAAPAQDTDFNNFKGVNAADPTADQDVTNKRYVDDVAGGGFATQAEAARDAAEGFRDEAEGFKNQAETARDAANTARTGAETAETNAGNSATAAAGSATAAANSAASVPSIGTGVGDAVGLEDVGGGTAGLPAVDGSQLLNLPAAGGPSLGTDAIIRTNGKTISEDITIPADTNGMSAGPITIAPGSTVTVLGDWTIV